MRGPELITYLDDSQGEYYKRCGSQKEWLQIKLAFLMPSLYVYIKYANHISMFIELFGPDL